MEWRDEGIVLGLRKHGESAVVVEAMTRTHGRHLGLVHGGRSRRQRPVLQPGNRLDLIWRARLDEQLGTYAVEPLEMNAARLMESAVAVFALQTLAAHLRLLPERDPHPALFDTLQALLRVLDDPAAAGELVVRFELLMLDELGFGLDLSECAATGLREDLAFVSPKSGRAVSRTAGEAWKDRLLPLPAFLTDGDTTRPDLEDIEEGFRLTGFFFARDAYEPRGISEPEARPAFIGAVRKGMQGPQPG